MRAPHDTRQAWTKFLEFAKQNGSCTAFENWLAPIKVLETTETLITLEIPNIFVKEYLLSNYKKDLCAFLPVTDQGEPSISFKIVVAKHSKPKVTVAPSPSTRPCKETGLKLNPFYTFDTFIEGPSNQFVKSAAFGVATHPGKSYNPLFIHGGVGLGKTHLLHGIGQYIQMHSPKLRVQCITTEAFINDLIDHLRSKSVDKLKRFYRSQIDVLLVDDIQFLQNRLNFEEELCLTFEALINQGKQIVITSDKPPSQLKLSERMIARMEWGLVAHVGIPELETRVAIIKHKAQLKGLTLSNDVAFFIAERIFHNVRQLEGAINRLSAHCRLLDVKITEEVVQRTLREMLQHAPKNKVTVDQILTSVATVFQVKVSDLKSSDRSKKVALPRQVAMYLACKLINGTLQTLSDSFGKAHSTLIYATQNIEKKLACNETLRRMIQMAERNLAA